MLRDQTCLWIDEIQHKLLHAGVKCAAALLRQLFIDQLRTRSVRRNLAGCAVQA